MIAYYDSSALLKIYINEKDSDLVRQFILTQPKNYISCLSYAEVHSAFSRLFNDSLITLDELNTLKANFNHDFKIFQSIPIDLNTLKRAAEITYLKNLRTLDSIHLASVEYLKLISDEELIFVCFDEKLKESANSIGIGLIK